MPNLDRGRILCVFLYGSLCCASALEQSLAITLRVGEWWSWVLCVASCLSSCPWARSKRPRVCPQNTRHMFDTSADTHGDVLNVSTRTLRCVVAVSVVVVVVFLLESSCRHVAVVMLSSRCCDEGQQDRHVVVLNTTGNHTSLTAHTVNHNKTVLKSPQSHRNHRRAIRKAIGMALGWFGWLWDGSTFFF